MKLNHMLKSLLLLAIITTFFTQPLNAKDKNILAYQDRGIKYYPKYVRKGHVKIGKASWYGKPFHGRLTANGERYNMYNMTAAHRTYAMGTRLKVTNLKNRRSVIVRVNDRGPFYSSRAIDLSYGAARKLGMVKSGVSPVKIEVYSSRSKSHKKRNFKKHTIKKYKKSSSKKNLKRTLRKKTTKRTLQKRASKESKQTTKVQLASFSSKKNAYNFKKRHHLKNVSIVKSYLPSKRGHIYRVIVKRNDKEAKKMLNSKKFLGAYLLK